MTQYAKATMLGGSSSSVITTEGDLIIGDSGGSEARLAVGASNYVLTSDGTTVSWQPAQALAIRTFIPAVTASDIGTYYELQSINVYTVGAAGSSAPSVTTSPTLLAAFATEPGYPNMLRIPVGLMELHFDTQKTAGANNYSCHFELYKRTAGGVETLLETSAAGGSSALNTLVHQEIQHIINTEHVLASTDRLVVKVYATMASSSATITLYWDDSYDSFFRLPSEAIDSSTYVPYSGATADVNLGTNKLSGANLIQGYTTTATAAGTTVLTVASNQQQYFTGSTTQTVTLPVTSTLTLGHSYQIVNNSSGVVTVQSSGANTIQAMAANTILTVVCILTSGTTASSWNAIYASNVIPAGGAGDMVLSSVQTITGAKTFGTIGGAVGKLILAGSTSGSSILNAAAVAGSTTLTLPGTTGTLALAPTVQSKTGDFTAASDYIYLVSSAAARAITLPAAASGARFFIKDSTGSCETNNFTLTRVASEKIDGLAANRVLQANWGSWTLVSDGTDWFIL